MSKKFGLLLLSVLLFVAVPAQTQTDTASPLLDLLALVPDREEVRRALVSYADYRSIEAARGIEMPTISDFQNDSELSSQWLAAINGLVSGMPEYVNLIRYYEETPEVIGFAFDDVDRSLHFGEAAESYGLVLSGDFNTTQITDAFTVNGFVQNDFDGITVLCNPDGCERGQDISLQHRNAANPFGGQFGRKQPLALLPDILVSSPVMTVVEDVLSAYRGEQSTLADAPDYRAIALAAADQGRISQIQFVSPLDLMMFDPAALMLDADSIENLHELTSGFEELPLYSLAAIADVWDGSQQRALILLAYADEANAQAAADELARRMETFVPPSTDAPFSEQLLDIGAVVDAPAVYADAETETWVAIWSFRYPMPANESENGEPLVASSLGFRYLINALYRRDLYVLALEPMQSE